eukprot:m.175480 g.175480  ORF g.175480 m.175480 type:complete len:53 (-) comp18355_c0_seq1:68-226(-)
MWVPHYAAPSSIPQHSTFYENLKCPAVIGHEWYIWLHDFNRVLVCFSGSVKN